MPFDPTILGSEVELSKIPAQLKALWDGGSRTRASLLNFVVHCQDTSSFAANTALISRFVRNHACRAILLGDCPSTNGSKITAWVQAHCRITKAGAGEVCSEQVTILAEGISPQGVSNAVLAILDYDLPLSLWWQGAFPDNGDAPLWSRVDRLLFDSLSWVEPLEALQRLDRIKTSGNHRMTVADLNWTRTLGFRQALAECFDAPLRRPALDQISQLEIHHAADARTTAWLLLSWFTAQLGWTPAKRDGDSIRLHNPSGGAIECRFAVDPIATTGCIAAVKIASGSSSVDLHREWGSPLLLATIAGDEGSTFAHYPAGNTAIENLLTEELTPGPRHRVYLKSLTALESLLRS
jgi:glucose-6-phosphate dehydrogenase assembly protein OpcA